MKDKEFLDPRELKKQEEAEAKFERDRKLRLSDMRKILSIPEGRRTIWRLLEQCKVFAPSFSLNTLQIAYSEGQRSIGITLLSDVEIAKPGIFAQMTSEAKSEENSAKNKEKEDDSRS